MILALLAAVTFFQPSHLREPDLLMAGAWSSCPDNEDGTYGERVMESRQKGYATFTVHLGPRDEFAIFAGPDTEAHPSHGDPDLNLLGTSFHYNDVEPKVGGRNWSTSTRLHFNAIRVDGSYSECYSYFVRLVRAPVTWAR